MDLVNTDGGEAMAQCSLSLESLRLEERNESSLSEESRGSCDEWDTDPEAEETEQNNKEMSTADIYLRACRMVGVVPVSYFLRNLGSTTLNLNHHGLGPLGCKALAIALAIETLELEDNYVLAEGAQHLVEILKSNITIQNLNLSNNHLQSEGAEHITKLLLENISIKSIKLSGNKFREDDGKNFSDAFSRNFRVKELDLSHNEFRERGGEHLGHMLANNEGLEVLDLSWNHLRMKGAVALCAGLRVNMTLKLLDLSWNGFGNEGALALGEALKFNNTLVHLDLSYNRITNEGVGMLCKGLEFNDTLRVLQLAYNSLTVEGALALIAVVRNTPKSALEEINISNVLVNENFVQLLEVTCQENPSLEVHYGGVGGFIAKKTPKRPDPMKLIQDYLDVRKLRLWDFFRNIDKEGTMLVPVSDFRRAMQQFSIPLDRYQIEDLIQRLDREQNGMVEYRGLADTRKEMRRDLRRQLRKVESRQKKEKQKSDRILKTFQSAVEASTSHGSLGMSGGTKEGSSGPRFSATPLSSWHHVGMSNSSHYSVTNLSNEHVHLPPIRGAQNSLSLSSPAVRSYSQPNLQREARFSTKPTSALGAHSSSNSDVDQPELSPTANLTRSRPALTTKQKKSKVKTTKKKRKKAKKHLDVSANSKLKTAKDSKRQQKKAKDSKRQQIEHDKV